MVIAPMPPTELKSTAEHAAYLKALSHPLRMQILHEMNRGVTSPKEIADKLGESLGVVSYHVRTLEELGCIELADTKFRRGAVQHFYRPLRRAELNDGDWAALPPSIRDSVTAVTLDAVIELAATALREGTFDARDDRHLTYVQLELDEAGWREVNTMLADVLKRATELQQRTNGNGPAVRSVLALAHFESA
jgi:DNA-binding transcriptional ArsR family regulator